MDDRHDASGAGREGEVGRARRRLALAALALAVVVGIVLLAEKAAGYRGVVTAVRSARPEWLLAALVAELASFCAYAWALRDVIRFRQGPTIRLRDSLRLVLASLGAGRVAVGAGAAGIVVDVWALRRAGFDRDEAAVRVAAFNVFVFAVFGAGAWLAAATVAAGVGGNAGRQQTVPWLIAVPFAALALVGLRAPKRRERLPGAPGRWLARVLRDAHDAVTLVRALVGHPRRHAGTTAAALAYWAADATCLWASLHAFAGHAPPGLFVLAYATGYLSTLLPLPLGGVGGVDAAMTFALRGAGVPLNVGLLAVLAYRFTGFWLPTLPGLAAFSTLERLGRKLERSDRPRTVSTP